VDERGTFREDSFQQAVAALNEAAAAAEPARKGGKGSKGQAGAGAAANGEGDDVFKLVRTVVERNYEPLIVFRWGEPGWARLRALGTLPGSLPRGGRGPLRYAGHSPADMQPRAWHSAGRRADGLHRLGLQLRTCWLLLQACQASSRAAAARVVYSTGTQP
jgi:hypothetical protein